MPNRCLVAFCVGQQVEKVEAEQALSEAIPALEEAAAALNDLKRDDITEIRSFAKPHILVQKVCADRHMLPGGDSHLSVPSAQLAQS